MVHLVNALFTNATVVYTIDLQSSTFHTLDRVCVHIFRIFTQTNGFVAILPLLSVCNIIQLFWSSKMFPLYKSRVVVWSSPFVAPISHKQKKARDGHLDETAKVVPWEPAKVKEKPLERARV